jgi:tRNA(adenine34) deaminase
MGTAVGAPQNVMDALERETQAALAADEVPVAACVVIDGKLIASAHNTCVRDHDASAHAEINALRAAGKALANYRLSDATLYVTMEPCAMCAGAILAARVASVVYGLADSKAGAAGSVVNLFEDAKLNHHARTISRDDALSAIGENALQTFFHHKRAQEKVPAFTIREVSWTEQHEALAKIRFDVFVREQKVPAAEEIDAQDPLSLHALACMKKDGMPIATGRLLPNGHIGRMAVLKGYRATGAGMAILQFLMAKARDRGFKSAELSAQTHAIGFYERAGFVAYGEEYLDCDIPHRMMRCTL